jgi:cytochrome oxidase Cu insertion factor (SCO1/SenC/PrrC family)
MSRHPREGRRQQPQRAVFGSRRNWLVWIGLSVLAVSIFAVTAFHLRSGAPSATASGIVGTRVGDTAPDFRLVDTNGAAVTRSSLVAERPGLMFFTATWCLPCVEGLKHLMKFQQDAGGNPFTVLIVFVDPRETDGDLREYRDRFSFPPTWHYALDRDNVVTRYQLRYLDTKYALDRAGVIRYADYSPADYKTWVRALATVGIRR